jgi:predicted transcriptional regulator
MLILLIGGYFTISLCQQDTGHFILSSPSPDLQIKSFTDLQSLTSSMIPLMALPAFSVNTPEVSQPSTSNSTRMQIYNYINANPGVQFRAICAGLTIPVGLAQYHLGVLVKSGLVSFVRDGKYKRFFVSKKFNKKQIAAITMLRHKTAKRIFEVLLNKKQLSHGKLADELCISSQALTWQMKSLKNTKFVLQVNDGLKTVYSIDESSLMLLETSLAVIK